MATVVPPLIPSTIPLPIRSPRDTAQRVDPDWFAVIVATDDLGSLTIADTAAVVAAHRSALDRGASLLWVETPPRRPTGAGGGAR